MTKVDFLTLDRILVQPVGLYGSRGEIIRFLLARSVITEQT